jgi:hypothetical protein
MDTLATVRALVRRRFEQEGIVRLTNARLDEAINAGVDEVAEMTGFRETYAVIDQKAGRTYYDLRQLFPDEVVMVTSIWSPELGIWLDYEPPDNYQFRQWEDVSGSPRKWFMRGLFMLGLFPHNTSAGERLHIYFQARHKPLVNDVDPLLDIPKDLVVAVVDYALFDLHMQDRQGEKAKAAYAEFKKNLDRLGYHINQRVTRPRIGRIGGRR